MNERDVLTQEFERHRQHLNAVAYRMLGSVAEAEDAVQESWLRLDRSDTGAVANLVGRSPVATCQLASRARRRVQGAAPSPDPDLAEQRRVVDAFLAASRAGDFDALIEVLDPDVVFRIETRQGEQTPVRGAAAVAERILARGTPLAPLARPAIVNGAAGAIVMPGRRPFAVIGFTQALALETAADGIRVNAVCPGYVRTSMQEREVVWESSLRGITPEEVRADYLRAIPLGRLEEPKDVARVVVFLVSDRAAYMTGQAVNVTGGAIMF